MMTNTLSTVRSVTRRQVITGMAATAGVLLVPSPHAASADVLDDASEAGHRVESSVLPRPIPGGVLTPVGVFIHHFPGPTRGAEESQITDFKGFVGGAHVTGAGSGTVDGVHKRLTFDLDNRFMQGTYVGVDGQRHFGTFGFI